MASVIGEYKIGKLIGEGAFSKVKLGVHTQTGQKVCFDERDSERQTVAESVLLTTIMKSLGGH